MILACDLGGTKSLLGLYEPDAPRPTPIVVASLPTSGYTNATELVRTFLGDHAEGMAHRISSACFGIAGPVRGQTARLTHAPLEIDAIAIRDGFGFERVRLLNDLVAMAYSVPVLTPSELQTLQLGAADPNGNAALIAAGTGLGEALLHNIDGHFVPSATESGHSDWAARDDRDIAILRALIQRFGRAAVEHVVSGRGLLNLSRITHTSKCPFGTDFDAPDAAAKVSAAALEGRCAACAEALEIFVSAYGAEAGNLALRTVATGGVFLGGGIAPKILPALSNGRFVNAFVDKGTFREFAEQIPVHVILNEEAGLLGAAVAAL